MLIALFIINKTQSKVSGKANWYVQTMEHYSEKSYLVMERYGEIRCVLLSKMSQSEAVPPYMILNVNTP